MRTSLIFLFAASCHLLLPAQQTPEVAGPAKSTPDPERATRPFPVPLAPLRQADIMWSTTIWRTIDLREKMNLPLYYPMEPKRGIRNLFEVITAAAKEGALTLYGNAAFDDEFMLPLTTSEVNSMLVRWDSTYQVEDVLNPGNFVTSPVKYELTGEEIRQYRVKELWYVDKQRSVLEVRIIGICPMAEKLSESGELVGLRPLFWISFEEARPILARAAVYNSHNDSEPMSYDELFLKRKFSSYIYKESNVYDRSIAEYRNGIDGLLEAELIGDRIFRYEEGLWHR